MHDGKYFVPGTDVVYHVQSFDHLTEARVAAVEVLGVLAVVADEELRTARVASGVAIESTPRS